MIEVMVIIEELIPKNEYERDYNMWNVLHNDKCEFVYYVVNLPFLPQIGQLIETRLGVRKVTYSLYNLEQNENTPTLEKTRIETEEC